MTAQIVSDAEIDRPYWRIGSDNNPKGGISRRLILAARPVAAIIRSVAPYATALIVGCQILSAFTVAGALVILNKALATLLISGESFDRLQEALPTLMLLFGIYALRLGLDTVTALARATLAPRARRAAEERLFRATLDVDLASFDDPDFYDRLKRARDRGILHLEGAIVALVDTLGAGLAVAGAVMALLLLHPLLPLLLLLALLPGGWGALAAARIQFAGMDTTVALMRHADMYGELATRRTAAPEVRANGAEDFVADGFSEAATKLQDHMVGLAQAEARLRAFASVLSGIGMVTAFILLGLMIRERMVDLAMAGAAVVAMRSAGESLNQLITSSHQLLEKALYIGDFQEFLDKAATRARRNQGMAAPEAPAIIDMKHVSFQYPGSSNWALHDVSLTIRAGETVAFAGENGSGKSTLAKLIGGLYPATEGTIYWDEKDLKTLSPASVSERVAMVLQDPVKWPDNARVNIEIGCPAAIGSDETRLMRAAEQSGAIDVINRLPEGWNTLLSREFRGGQDLSAGQWQRLAIARGLYRDAPVVIWDEPTAPLDAKAELAAYESLRRLAEGRTVVLITHRLTSIRDVDRIFFLKAGQLAEQGSHEELMALNGEYAHLFGLQATLYQAAAL
jgi:ATP-binding cassette, subfamily B, bacterial